jgi:hypothetical protein
MIAHWKRSDLNRVQDRQRLSSTTNERRRHSAHSDDGVTCDGPDRCSLRASWRHRQQQRAASFNPLSVFVTQWESAGVRPMPIDAEASRRFGNRRGMKNIAFSLTTLACRSSSKVSSFFSAIRRARFCRRIRNSCRCLTVTRIPANADVIRNSCKHTNTCIHSITRAATLMLCSTLYMGCYARRLSDVNSFSTRRGRSQKSKKRMRSEIYSCDAVLTSADQIGLQYL